MKKNTIAFFLVFTFISFSLNAAAEGNCRFYFENSYTPVKEKYNSKLGENILGQAVFTLIKNEHMDNAVASVEAESEQFSLRNTALIKDQVCVTGNKGVAENVIIMGSGLMVIEGERSNSGKKEVYFYSARANVSLKFNTFSINREYFELVEVGVLFGDKNGVDHTVKGKRLKYICEGKDQSKYKEQNLSYSDHKIATYAAFLVAKNIVSPQVSFKIAYDMLWQYTVTAPVCSRNQDQLFSSVRGLLSVKPEFSKSGKEEAHFFETQLDVDTGKGSMSLSDLTTIDMSVIVQ